MPSWIEIGASARHLNNKHDVELPSLRSFPRLGSTMFRSFAAVLCVGLAIPISSAIAGGHHHSHYGGFPTSSYGGYSFGGYGGFGYGGYGYGGYSYDPYRGGSFRAPDLLDDPYFRAQHKFDSHFPGRYSRRPPLQWKHAPRHGGCR